MVQIKTYGTKYNTHYYIESSYEIWFIEKVSLLLMAIEAFSSAISLPIIPECPCTST